MRGGTEAGEGSVGSPPLVMGGRKPGRVRVVLSGTEDQDLENLSLMDGERCRTFPFLNPRSVYESPPVPASRLFLPPTSLLPFNVLHPPSSTMDPDSTLALQCWGNGVSEG